MITTIPVGQAPWAFGQFVGPLATVAPPTFDPPGSGAVYALGVTVKITSPTPGASIRYTQDGSIPTATTGTLISNGQSVEVDPVSHHRQSGAQGGCLQNRGWADSEVSEATYTINRLSFFSGGSNP